MGIPGIEPERGMGNFEKDFKFGKPETNNIRRLEDLLTIIPKMRPNRRGATKTNELSIFIFLRLCKRESGIRTHVFAVKRRRLNPLTKFSRWSFKTNYQRLLAKSLIILFYHYFSLTIPAFLPQNYREFTAFLPQNYRFFYRFSQTKMPFRYCQANASKALSSRS